MSDDPTAPGDDPPAPDDDVGPGGDGEEGPEDAPEVAPDTDEAAGAPGEAGETADDPGPAPDPAASGDDVTDEDDSTGDTDELDGPAAAAADEAPLEDASSADDEDADGEGGDGEGADGDDVPDDVRKYERFTKVDGAQYERVNDFLRERTYVTAREWAIARLCADFRTETGVEMTKIGDNLDELVPFMEDTYSPQAVNQARSSFEEKVHKAGATFLYGAMSDFFTAEELDELMYEVTEVAKFLLEVESVDLSVEEELEAEDRISGVMREVREASEQLRYEECPHCGEQLHE